ncbi:MAG: sigma-54 dependent transcriptional regulator [Magnetococcus sp. WYHC-3]
MPHILLCEDENNLRQLLALALEESGHEVTAVPDGRAAMEFLARPGIDLVLTDLRLPDISGLEVLRRARVLDASRPVLLMTAFASTETAVTAMREGAFDYLEKPFRVEDLRLVVTRALEQRALHRENADLRRALAERGKPPQLIASAPAMRILMERVARVSRTDATVLIGGESGTGKELIARTLHALGPRQQKPFVAVNCAAIPENLFESELFGHTRGAFSGAVQARKGLFVEADGGTLFLDEIGEMPLGVQAKLLRALQEQTIRPVGGTGEKPVDVRVVAASNRELEQEVAAGRFRADLYYRIHVVKLLLPPLRERREDIPLLAAQCIERFAARYNPRVKRLSADALACLMAYDFPGNVRELENLLEGAVALADGETVSAAALPALGCARTPEHLSPEGGLPLEQIPETGLDLERHLAEVERGIIHQALSRVGGNKTRAAALLGLTFRSLRYRLARLEGREEDPD